MGPIVDFQWNGRNRSGSPVCRESDLGIPRVPVHDAVIAAEQVGIRLDPVHVVVEILEGVIVGLRLSARSTDRAATEKSNMQGNRMFLFIDISFLSRQWQYT